MLHWPRAGPCAIIYPRLNLMRRDGAGGAPSWHRSLPPEQPRADHLFQSNAHRPQDARTAAPPLQKPYVRRLRPTPSRRSILMRALRVHVLRRSGRGLRLLFGRSTPHRARVPAGKARPTARARRAPLRSCPIAARRGAAARALSVLRSDGQAAEELRATAIGCGAQIGGSWGCGAPVGSVTESFG